MAAAAQRGDARDLVIPDDRPGFERGDEQLAQRAAVDLGATPGALVGRLIEMVDATPWSWRMWARTGPPRPPPTMAMVVEIEIEVEVEVEVEIESGFMIVPVQLSSRSGTTTGRLATWSPSAAGSPKEPIVVGGAKPATW